MRIACSLHGLSPSVMISEDLAAGVHQGEPIVDVIYIDEGRPLWMFYVSRRFADENGIEPGTAQLPSEPGSWALKLACCCRYCFERSRNGYIDEKCRWHLGKMPCDVIAGVDAPPGKEQRP